MNRNNIIFYTPSFFLGGRERLCSLKTCKREKQTFSHSLVKGWGRLGAPVAVLVALVVLTSCPATPGGRGGIGNVCANGTPVEGSTDTPGQTRCASCNPLYRLDGISCQLVTLGVATRISMVSQFGVVEDSPYDLAAIDGTLYMIGADTDVLYTLNIDPDDSTPDGMAIQVGGVARFGVSETTPTGLAAIGRTLYMAGADTDVLYTLNIDPDDSTPDGMAIQVGGVARFGVSEATPTGLAAIGRTLYMVGADTDVLYTLNIDPYDSTPDGMAIQVGGVARFGVSETTPTGLAAIGGTLYMVGSSNDVLFTLNIGPYGSTPAGMAVQVGSVTRFGVSETTPTGLAAIGGTLYMVGQDSDALYALRYQ